jgi:hypothetical protein
MEVAWTEYSDSLTFKGGGHRYARPRHDVISSESLTSEELRYLAGFFDGEGSVGLYYNRKQKLWKARLSIAQNDSKHAMRLFSQWARVFSGNVYKRKTGDLELHIWKRQSIIAFIQYVGPYCIGKRQQMLVLENWLTSRMYSYRTAQILKALKRN